MSKETPFCYAVIVSRRGSVDRVSVWFGKEGARREAALFEKADIVALYRHPPTPEQIPTIFIVTDDERDLPGEDSRDDHYDKNH